MSATTAVTKDAILASLAAVPSPDGTPLPRTGKLSDIVVSDGKVFFSITVDAAVVQSWEPVRKAAETAVRAVAGVTSAMVALTGERTGTRGTQTPPQRPQAAPSPHAGSRIRNGPMWNAALSASNGFRQLRTIQRATRDGV